MGCDHRWGLVMVGVVGVCGHQPSQLDVVTMEHDQGRCGGRGV